MRANNQLGKSSLKLSSRIQNTLIKKKKKIEKIEKNWEFPNMPGLRKTKASGVLELLNVIGEIFGLDYSV